MKIITALDLLYIIYISGGFPESWHYCEHAYSCLRGHQAVVLSLGPPLGTKWGKQKKSYSYIYWEIITCQALGESLVEFSQSPFHQRGAVLSILKKGSLYPSCVQQADGGCNSEIFSFDIHIFPPSQGNYRLKSEAELKAKSQCPLIWMLSNAPPGSQGAF